MSTGIPPPLLGIAALADTLVVCSRIPRLDIGCVSWNDTWYSVG